MKEQETVGQLSKSVAYNLAYLLHNSHKCECSQNAIQQTEIQNSEKLICLKTTCPTKNTSLFLSPAVIGK